MKRIGMLGAAMVAAGALWAADPTITLSRVQQRYPWNGMVDIDYTVADVPAGSEASYYVRFNVAENGNTHVLHEFMDASTLADASNGTYRVTWDSEDEGSTCQFFTTNATVTAELVYCGDDKSNLPYQQYLVLDLTAGATAQSYPVAYEYRGFSAATNRYNTTEYKTNKLVLRRVKAGVFQMGSPATGTPESVVRESTSWMGRETQHQVTLTNDYFLGVFEVTQAQYANVMGTNPSAFTTDAEGNPAAERPVERVNYQILRGSSKGIARPPVIGNFDDTSFLGILKQRTGLVFDLPTEAQWEYACRAGTETATYAGEYTTNETVVGSICWYQKNSGMTTHGAGQKLPNAWGFYDILGNAWELCLDRTRSGLTDNFGYPVGEEVPEQVDPLLDTGASTCVRGGGWDYATPGVRAAIRSNSSESARVANFIGVRLSRTLP